jgi:hypothetical protein
VNETNLKMALAAAVPLCIWDIHQTGTITDSQIKHARELAHDLGAHGDNLLFGGGKSGEAAQLFERLAEAIAILAYSPGGVTLFGMHFEEQFIS